MSDLKQNTYNRMQEKEVIYMKATSNEDNVGRANIDNTE